MDEEDIDARFADLEAAALADATFISALLRMLPASVLPALRETLSDEAERSRVLFLNEPVSERIGTAFESHVQAYLSTLDARLATPP